MCRGPSSLPRTPRLPPLSVHKDNVHSKQYQLLIHITHAVVNLYTMFLKS